MVYHVLICEDDRETQTWLSHCLQQWGFSVINAYTGLDAISMACFEPPDLILLDMVLPDVDSIAILRKLSMESKTSTIPVIALAPTEWIAERLSDVPVAGVVQKPLNEQILEKAVRGILPEFRSHKTQSAAVLVYDNKEEVCEAIESCLESIGLRMLCAANIAAAESAMTEPTLQAAIIVLRTGSNDAQEILRRFTVRKPPLPVVAITERLEPQAVQSLSASGVHEIIVQPFSGLRLAAAVKSALSRNAENTGKENSKRVLLVEDAALAAKMMGSLLEHAGYRVTHAANAESAMQLLRQQHPEFMLLDVILPGMDGVEFVHQIQQSDLHIPFAVVTGIHDPRRMSVLQSMGALRVFEKPIRSEELLGFMDNYFSRGAQPAIRRTAL